MNEWTQCLSSKIGADKLKKLTMHPPLEMHVGGPKQVRFKKSLGSVTTERLKQFLIRICFGFVVRNCARVLFNPLTRDEAKTLIDKMLKFEPILTATIFNRIFSIATPLSECLQTCGLDLLQAWRMMFNLLLENLK
jgi:hypothetical protein